MTKENTPKVKESVAASKIPLSEALAAFMGSPSASRPDVTKAIWLRIKSYNLQDPKNKSLVNPDDVLSTILGKDPIHINKIFGALNIHYIKI